MNSLRFISLDWREETSCEWWLFHLRTWLLCSRKRPNMQQGGRSLLRETESWHWPPSHPHLPYPLKDALFSPRKHSEGTGSRKDDWCDFNSEWLPYNNEGAWLQTFCKNPLTYKILSFSNSNGPFQGFFSYTVLYFIIYCLETYNDIMLSMQNMYKQTFPLKHFIISRKRETK